MTKADKIKLVAALKGCGAEKVSLEQNGHYKLKFSNGENESRIITIASTPSDRRARKNMVSTIRRELKRIGLVDQRFTVRMVFTSRPPEDAIWNLLDEWEHEEAEMQPSKPSPGTAK